MYIYIYISNIHALKLYVYVYTCNIKVEIKLPWGTKKTNKREGEEEGIQPTISLFSSLVWPGLYARANCLLCSLLHNLNFMQSMR